MGTYTDNYNLFMPSIGEQGWGDLVNGNFSTIDTTMKGLDTRVGTLETEGDAIAARVTVLETGNFDTITANTVTADTIDGKFIGKIRIMSFADSSPVFKLFDIVSLGKSVNAPSGTNVTISTVLDSEDVSVKQFENQLYECGLTDTEILSTCTANCNITIKNNYADSSNTLVSDVTVTDSNGTVIHSIRLSYRGQSSASTTFVRNLGTTYSVTVTGLYNGFGRVDTVSFTFDTITKYMSM